MVDGVCYFDVFCIIFYSFLFCSNAIDTMRDMNSSEQMKLCTDTIQSLAFHARPLYSTDATTTLLLAAGDKYGQLSVTQMHLSTHDNTFVHAHTNTWRPSTKTISCVSFGYQQQDINDRIFMCSYDGSVRYMDVVSEQFMQVISHHLLSSMDMFDNVNFSCTMFVVVKLLIVLSRCVMPM
jgi:hypothetical protein